MAQAPSQSIPSNVWGLSFKMGEGKHKCDIQPKSIEKYQKVSNSAIMHQKVTPSTKKKQIGPKSIKDIPKCKKKKVRVNPNFF